MGWRRSRVLLFGAVALLAVFFAWRFLRPMNIFVVSEAFERPIESSGTSPVLGKLHAAQCGSCHQEEHREWRTTVHSRAWTDPYYQVDWTFDGRQQICKNCHTPLDRQQEDRVLGFLDRDKWQPVLAANPDFDAALQKEGVTCAGCHLRDGKILGPRGSRSAPHPTQQVSDPNEICVRCHVVQGKRWDTFYRMPPCGTTAEIAAARDRLASRGGEYLVRDLAELGCVQCHMPVREGAGSRAGRRHLWRGGHDLATVRSALTASLSESVGSDGSRVAELELANTGAAHFLPTGTPDRYLTVNVRALDAGGRVIREATYTLERVVMWRPFIVDLWDTRLPRGAPRRYVLSLPSGTRSIEAEVRYHLLGEPRRKRIGYEPEEPISYVMFEQRLSIAPDL